MSALPRAAARQLLAAFCECRLDDATMPMIPSAIRARLLAQPPLAPCFFTRPAELVAPELIGKILLTGPGEQMVAVRIVEVEAYLGASDPASHAYRGPTARSQIMFAPGGVCYVYLSYGMHICMNVVTGHAGEGEAVLLRAAEPLINPGLMAKRRGMDWDGGPLPAGLSNGPGKLCAALGVDLTFSGRSYRSEDFRLVDNPEAVAITIAASPRIGISKARDLPLRFYAKGSRFVSKVPRPPVSDSAPAQLAASRER